MALTTTELNQLYLAYFGRPGDVDGLNYYKNWTLADVQTGFSNSPESQAMYGTTFGAAQVNAIYQNLFNRSAEPAGIDYWINAVNNGVDGVKISPAAAAFSILVGAQNADKTAVENKLAAVTSFLAGLDTTAEILAYSGAAANTVAKNWLATVTSDAATLTAAQASVGTTINTIASTTVANGQTFTLTSSADVIVGTTANDTINAIIDAQDAALGATSAKNTTLQAVDSINGGAGVDTLAIIANGTTANTVTPLFLSNVEKVSVKDVIVAGATTVDLVNATGVTEVINNASVSAVIFNNIGSAAVSVKDVVTAVTTTFTRGATSVSSDLTMNLENLGRADAPGSAAVAAGAVNSNDPNSNPTNVTINTKGYVSVAGVAVAGEQLLGNGYTAQKVTVNAAGTTILGGGVAGFDTTKAGNLTVTGAGVVNLGALAGAVKTLDASASTGGVTATATQYTGTDAASAAAPGLSMTGGAGNDAFTLNGVASAVVNAGAGDDTVTILAATLTAGASINGGDGVDTIAVTSATADALDNQNSAGTALRATLTNFEAIAITDTLAANFNVKQAGNYNYLKLNGDVSNAGAAVTVSGFTTGATVEFNNAADQTAAINISVTDAATTTTDSVNLLLNANLINTSDFDVRAGISGVNIVNVTAKDAVDNVVDNNVVPVAGQDNNANEGYSLFLTNAENLNTLNITGSSMVNYTLSAGTNAVKTIDASSSTGNSTINVAAFAGTERVEIKGSQGTNTITGSAVAFGEKITGGAKADSITGGAGADDMTGNGGRDVFVIGLTDSGMTAATVDQITDFGKVTVAATATEVTAMNSVAAFQAAATAKGGTDADVLALTGATIATAKSSADDAAINVALEALDATQTEFAGKVINATIAKGVLTVGGADAAMVDSLAKWIAVANVAAETLNETVAFQFNGNTYVYQQNTPANTVDDLLVELTGLTDVKGVVLAGSAVAAVAAAVGDIFIV